MEYKKIPIHDIVIYKHPIIYLQLALTVAADLFSWIIRVSIQRLPIIVLAAAVTAFVYYVEFMQPVKAFMIFAAYWVILGIASSIGLGTGLHTFVLYLGPHIAKVTMVATSCQYLPEMLPSRWNFDHFASCSQKPQQVIGFLGILLAVQLQSFLWGFGTAIGELPPYFVAKKAADSNEQLIRLQKSNQLGKKQENEEREHLIENPTQIEQINQLRKRQNKAFIDKAKIFLYDNLQKYGFITILLGASIPNPLFDLAGITCGHFRVPFKKFFFATFIGKAIIKVHIQMLFVIFVFRKETVDILIKSIQSLHKGLATILQSLVEKQRENLHNPSNSDEKGLVAKLWDIFIILMVAYFLISIVTTQVQQKAARLKDKKN